MKPSTCFASVVLACAASATALSANAASSASAALSFQAVSTGGFAWSSGPLNVSSASSDASAADFTGWLESAGVYSPTFGAASVVSDLQTGTALPFSTASTSGTDSSALARTIPLASISSFLEATVLVPTAGLGSSTAFGRSWFTLAPGASVTFQGVLELSVAGDNPSLPPSYSSTDLYGFASGLLAVGDLEDGGEIGGPASTGGTGPYAISDTRTLTLTYTNTTGETVESYLDSGVSAYSASAVAPIPEPSTYALLLSGLALVGVAAQRRRSSR